MECKNCGLEIQESYLYCPSCGSPSYSSLYSELIKINYFLSEFDTWQEEGLVEEEAVLPIKQRYLAKKQEILTLLQSSREAAPIQQDEVFRELKEKFVEKSFDKTKKLFEEELREITGEPIKIDETSKGTPHPSTLSEIGKILEEEEREEISPPLPIDQQETRVEPESVEPVPQEAHPETPESSKVKISLSAGLEEESYSALLTPQETPPLREISLTQEQLVVAFVAIAGVFGSFFISLKLPLSHYPPLFMFIGAAAVFTSYYVMVNTKREEALPHLWSHPLTFMGYTLTFLALLLSAVDLTTPGIIAITLTLATLLYIFSTVLYKKPLFVYLSALTFVVLYLIGLSGVVSVMQGEDFQWFPLSLPVTCFAFIPLTVFGTYLARQYDNLEGGRLSKPLYQLTLTLSLAILLITLGMLYYESASALLDEEGSLSFQMLFFPSHAASYQVAWALVIFLTYSVLYAICSSLYEQAAFVYLTNSLLVLSTGLGISYLGQQPLLPLSLCALSYIYFFVAQSIEKNILSKVHLDLYKEETFTWQRKLLTYSYPLLHSAIAISILTLLMAWNSPLILILLGIFSTFLVRPYPSQYRYWVYLAGILFIGSIYFSWITQLPIRSWDSVVMLMALALFLLGYLIQTNQRTLCQAFSLVEQDYHQPLFRLSIFLFIISLALYFTDFANIASDSYTLLLATLFCGLGFYLKGETAYLILLFMISFALNFSFWTASIKDIHFDYLSVSSSLLTLAWLGITYQITQSSSRQLFEKLNLPVSDQVRQAIADTFYPLIFIYTLISLFLTLGRLSFATILTLFITGTIYTCYAHIFKSAKWLYGANLAIDIGVFYFVFWLKTPSENPYFVTSYLGLSALVLCIGWIYLSKYYETQGELPEKDYLRSFASSHFLMAWAILPAFIALMSLLFLSFVPSPQLGSVGVHLLILGCLTTLYIWLAVSRQQEKFLYLSEAGLAFVIFFMRLTRPDYFAGGRVALWLILASVILMELGYLTQKYHTHILTRWSYYTALLLPFMSLMLIRPWEISGYGVVSMFAIAGFYIWVNYLSQPAGSFIYIGLLLSNLSLFTLWSWSGLTLASSPQLYLVPVALTVIGISWLSKSLLSYTTFHNIRFFSTLFILTVSYFEMLLAGENWRVDFLTILCTAGIVLGLAWRIKAFFYLGTLFLSLNLLTRLLIYLYHNAWLLWGILVGVGLFLVLIWIIRRKKQTLMPVLEGVTQELSTWE